MLQTNITNQKLSPLARQLMCLLLSLEDHDLRKPARQAQYRIGPRPSGWAELLEGQA
jgi:hypothetical protein